MVSLRGRLVFLVGTVLAPALILATVVIFRTYANERASAAERLLIVARAVASVVDGEMGHANGTLTAFAATDAVRQRDLAKIDAMARTAITEKDHWFVLMDTDGQQLVNTRAAPGSPLPKMTDLEEAFTSAINEKKHYVSDLRDGPVAKTLVVHVSHPEIREGKVIGSLTIGMLPTALARSLDVERFAGTGVVAIADKKGRIISRSKNAEKYVGSRVMPDIQRLIDGGQDEVRDSVTLEGVPVLAAVARARCGWTVAIGVPKSDLYAPAQVLFRWGLLATLLLAIAVMTTAYWIGRSVVREMDALTDDAKALGRGEQLYARTRTFTESEIVGTAMQHAASALTKRTQTLELLNRVNASLVAERDLQKIVQSVTDAGREASGAAFGAFFYNVENDVGESYTLFTLSGAPREAFERFGMPRNTPVFGPTFHGEGTVRVADILADPRYGTMAPHHGMPKGHLPVRSYLAVSVKTHKGEVIGGLFFGHPEVGVFTQEAEDIVEGLAAEAAIAIENAKLYQSLSRELAAKSRAEAELRAAQLQLQRHAEELEQQVETRTRSLKDAIAQMEEFSYTVSHDLRSPLRAVVSYSNALLEDHSANLNEEARDFLNRILRSVLRMDQLTTDLLTYSRVARAEVTLAPTDLEAVVRSTVEHYPELHEAAQVTISTPLLPVLAHEASLRQCVANLLINAAKFVKAGETPHITVRTEAVGERVRIWIDDEGIGISPEYQKKLFQVFERVPTKQKFEGTGIGLAIVRKAAEKMGGRCGVESDGKSGSHFWVELGAVK